MKYLRLHPKGILTFEAHSDSGHTHYAITDKESKAKKLEEEKAKTENLKKEKAVQKAKNEKEEQDTELEEKNK